MSIYRKMNRSGTRNRPQAGSSKLLDSTRVFSQSGRKTTYLSSDSLRHQHHDTRARTTQSPFPSHPSTRRVPRTLCPRPWRIPCILSLQFPRCLAHRLILAFSIYPLRSREKNARLLGSNFPSSSSQDSAFLLLLRHSSCKPLSSLSHPCSM